MSVDAMSYVWKTALAGAQKLMLLAIADRADEKGVCYPGIDKLAEKCGIKIRAAQKLISKLEELGELVVEVAGGTKTSSGKTNRYYMKKFRDTLKIETPTFGSRGVQTYTPQGVSKRTPDGMSKVTPLGVSKRTPNTKEYTTEEITTLAPLARSILEVKICPIIPAKQIDGMILDTSQLPKVQLDDKDLNKRVRAIITTYLSVSGTVKSNAHALWNADAKQLVLQGIDNKHIAKFISEKRKEPFFSDKSVTWNVVTSQIVAWNHAYEKAQKKAAEPDLHAQWGVTPDDYQLPNLYDSPFDLKYSDEQKAG